MHQDLYFFTFNFSKKKLTIILHHQLQLFNMKKLILVRHAKSDWPEGIDDFNRPLAERGKEDAPREWLNFSMKKG